MFHAWHTESGLWMIALISIITFVNEIVKEKTGLIEWSRGYPLLALLKKSAYAPYLTATKGAYKGKSRCCCYYLSQKERNNHVVYRYILSRRYATLNSHVRQEAAIQVVFVIWTCCCSFMGRRNKDTWICLLNKLLSYNCEQTSCSNLQMLLVFVSPPLFNIMQLIFICFCSKAHAMHLNICLFVKKWRKAKVPKQKSNIQINYSRQYNCLVWKSSSTLD